MRTGQLIPCIGHRPNPDQPTVLLYDGQRRLLAANASHELAGTDGFEGLAPVRTLIVLLLDHEPTPDEIRRIQAQANQREELSLFKTSSSSSPTAGTPAPACQTTTASSRSAPTSASPPSARTTCAASSPSPNRSANASPSAPPASSSRSRWQTASPTCTRSRPTSPRPSPSASPAPTCTTSALRDLGAFVHRTDRRRRAHLRRPHRRRRHARRRRADRARPRAPHRHRPRTARPDPRLRTGQGRPRARHAHRPRQDQGAQDQDHPGDPRPRPRRTLRLRPPRADRTSPTASGSSTPCS